MADLFLDSTPVVGKKLPKGADPFLSSTPSSSDIARGTQVRGLQKEAFAATQEATQANSFGGIARATVGGVWDRIKSALYGIALPTSTPQEQNLKTLGEVYNPLNLGKAALGLGAEAVTSPLKTVQSVAEGYARGLADVATNAVINFAPGIQDRNKAKTDVQSVLDKYLMPPASSWAEGFKLAGEMTPALLGGAAGEAAGSALGSTLAKYAGADAKLLTKSLEVAGAGAGFVGAGQSQLPLEATINQRVDQALNDLVGLGVFKVADLGYSKAKVALTDAFTKKAALDTATTEVQKVKGETPQPTEPNVTDSNIPQKTADVRKSKLDNSVPVDELQKTNPQYVDKISNPDGTITVYRNVGDTGATEIKPGDYVTTDKGYAERLKSQGSVISADLPASDVRVIPGMDSTVRGEAFYVPKDTFTQMKGFGPSAPPVDTSAPTKIAGMSLGTVAKAVEEQIKVDFGGLPEFNPMSMKEQTLRATEFALKDPEAALRVIRLEEPPPKGIQHPAFVYSALERIALQERNGAMLREIAHSDTAPLTSWHAQALKAADSGWDNPARIIQDVENARSQNMAAGKEHFTAAEKKKVVNEAIKSVDGDKSVVQAIVKWIKGITCGF